MRHEFDPSVCHCPSVYMFGGFGCVTHSKFPELVENDVRVVLGSDACVVSRFVDMVRIMYLAACAHKDCQSRSDSDRSRGAHGEWQ